jgi:hypothetical protein
VTSIRATACSRARPSMPQRGRADDPGGALSPSARTSRVGLLVGVASFRRTEDAPRPLADLRTANNPLLQSQIASALASTTPTATDGLHAGARPRPPARCPRRRARRPASRSTTTPACSCARCDRGLRGVAPDWPARALVSTA